MESSHTHPSTDVPESTDSHHGLILVHREDEADGQQVFVLRDEQGTEIARSSRFPVDVDAGAEASAPARNALDRLREGLTERGWEIAQRPNASFGDAWWAYRFAPGPTAVEPALLAEALAAPGVPRLRLGRRKRRERQRRSVKLPSTSVIIFAFFSLFMLTVTIGFMAAVLWILSR